MLLLINIRDDEPRKIVQYFEVVKEKAPELVLTFDQLLAIGKAYRDINEYERAMIVWRGLIEASYLEDARVGELLAPARQDAGGDRLPDRPLAAATPTRPRSRATSSASRRSWPRRPRRRSPTPACAASWPPPASPGRSCSCSRSA